jgi:serine/threonine protein kinase
MLNQILGVLDFVYTNNPTIIYRDIKPADILYQGNQGDKFLLIDFGIVKVVDTSRIMTAGQLNSQRTTLTRSLKPPLPNVDFLAVFCPLSIYFKICNYRTALCATTQRDTP